MMQRLLPHPAQSLLLLCTWLLLVDSIAFGHWLLGGFLAIVIPLLLGPLLVEHPRAWKPLRLLRYLLMVIGDILVANFQVARLTLGRVGELRPAFVEVPIELDNELAISILVSLSRVMLGVHYPSDVLAGWIAGAGWALLASAWLSMVSIRSS